MTEYIIDWDTNLVIDTFSKNNLREEIVRCRDCKYRYGCLHLVDDGDDDMRRCHATPDGFCAWGERRERESAEVWNQWSADDVTCSEES